MRGYGCPLHITCIILGHCYHCIINEWRRCQPENPFTNIQIKVIPLTLLKVLTELGIAFVHTINVKCRKLKVQERKLLQDR